MGLFEEAMDEGEKFAREHPDQVNKEMGAAEKFVDERTGDKYDSEIQSLGDEAEKRFEQQ
ncbi:MAG TPA: antitoxin [Propionibacteriaceae bacterium]|nr:antitoxin [Propionibacteriaceae bacterium]